VPWNDPAYIMKILDAGAYGIICPMINSRKEAEQLVRTCKYAPKGYRSFGPVRASALPAEWPADCAWVNLGAKMASCG
jgi:4-hydroxy-2-oxoheptanedioate aldolase